MEDLRGIQNAMAEQIRPDWPGIRRNEKGECSCKYQRTVSLNDVTKENVSDRRESIMISSKE